MWTHLILFLILANVVVMTLVTVELFRVMVLLKTELEVINEKLPQLIQVDIIMPTDPRMN